MSDTPVFSRAALLARPSLAAALDTMREAAVWLDAHGCVPGIDRVGAEAAGLTGPGARWTVVDRDDLAASADVVIAFGGDGTLLDAALGLALAGAAIGFVGGMLLVIRSFRER